MKKFMTFLVCIGLGAACASVGDHMLPPGVAQGPFVEVPCDVVEIDETTATTPGTPNTLEVHIVRTTTYAEIAADPWDIQVKTLSPGQQGCDAYQLPGYETCTENQPPDRSFRWNVPTGVGNADGVTRVTCSQTTDYTYTTRDGGGAVANVNAFTQNWVAAEEVWYR